MRWRERIKNRVETQHGQAQRRPKPRKVKARRYRLITHQNRSIQPPCARAQMTFPAHQHIHTRPRDDTCPRDVDAKAFGRRLRYRERSRGGRAANQRSARAAEARRKLARRLRSTRVSEGVRKKASEESSRGAIKKVAETRRTEWK